MLVKKSRIFIVTAAENIGTHPKETWVFEDALYAIQTAKNAGFRTVGVFDASSVENFRWIKRTSDIYLEKLNNINVFLEKAFL